MPHPKKKFRPMIYYTIFDIDKHFCFCNKSTNPVVSVRHHFNRSKNPNRKDYNSDFYVWLRSLPPEKFLVTYSEEQPECATRRAHLVALEKDAVIPKIVDYDDLYEEIVNRKNIL